MITTLTIPKYHIKITRMIININILTALNNFRKINLNLIHSIMKLIILKQIVIVLKPHNSLLKIKIKHLLLVTQFI